MELSPLTKKTSENRSLGTSEADGARPFETKTALGNVPTTPKRDVFLVRGE
jgi:hypothetical protein